MPRGRYVPKLGAPPGGIALTSHPDDRAAQDWATAIVESWNEGAGEKLASFMAPDIVFDVPVRRDGGRDRTFIAGRAAFIAAFPRLKSRIPRFEFVSVLGDDASASLILRDPSGELLTVLLAFDGQHRIKHVTSYRRRVPASGRAGLLL